MLRPRSSGAVRRLHRHGALTASSGLGRRLLVLCALVAAPTVLLGPALLPGRALLPADLLLQFEPWRSQVAFPPESNWDPLVWDGIAQYYPWRLFASESVRGGHFPLWNPYQFCGTPFLANGQSAVLYPLNLLFWALPVAWAFGLSAWLHLCLAGWFAYLFLRRIGARRFGALAGAVVWQTNSFFVAWLHLPTVICTASWLPLVLLLCERALVTGRGRFAVGAGLALALSYLGGHPQMFLFVVLMAAAYTLVRGLGQPARLRLGYRLFVLLSTGAVTGLVAGGLSAAQLLPTLDLMRIAHRAFVPGPQSYAAFLSHALPWPMLSGLLLPHPLGHPALGTYVGPENYAEYCCYIGIAALALAVWGASASRTWHARFFAAAALLALLVAAGTPLNWPLYHWLPGMPSAGGPARIVLLAVFSLSMLAGLGADAIASRCEQRGATRAVPALALVLILLGAGLGTWWFLVGPRFVPSEPNLWGESGETLRAAALIAAAFILSLGLCGRALRKAAQVAFVALLAADLLLAAQHHAHIVPREWVYAPQADPGPVDGRVLGNATRWPLKGFPDAVLPPNAAMVYHLRDAFGYDSLYLAHYRDFASLIQGADPSPPLNGNLLLARLGPVYGADMMGLAAVESVLSAVPIRWLQLDRAGAFLTYGNPYARPRAWVAGSAVSVPTHLEAFSALTRLGVMEDCVVITGPDEPAADLPAEPRPALIVRDLSPNAVSVGLPRGGGGYLFLADSYAPGWHAYAGGRELPVLVADVTFRAVPLPREAANVVLRYEPASFRVGGFLGLLSLAAVVCLLGWLAAARGSTR